VAAAVGAFFLVLLAGRRSSSRCSPASSCTCRGRRGTSRCQSTRSCRGSLSSPPVSARCSRSSSGSRDRTTMEGEQPRTRPWRRELQRWRPHAHSHSLAVAAMTLASAASRRTITVCGVKGSRCPRGGELGFSKN
jgi:hypothetical protein